MVVCCECDLFFLLLLNFPSLALGLLCKSLRGPYGLLRKTPRRNVALCCSAALPIVGLGKHVAVVSCLSDGGSSPGFEYPFYHWLAVRSWASDLASLRFKVSEA